MRQVLPVVSANGQRQGVQLLPMKTQAGSFGHAWRKTRSSTLYQRRISAWRGVVSRRDLRRSRGVRCTALLRADSVGSAAPVGGTQRAHPSRPPPARMRERAAPTNALLLSPIWPNYYTCRGFLWDRGVNPVSQFTHQVRVKHHDPQLLLIWM